jgi:methylglutaconyl-CoA hydratase
MSYQTIIQAIDNQGVGYITLNRPEHHNAFNEVMVHELAEIFVDFSQNPAVKIIVLNSQGQSFSSGADLQWMKKMANYSETENIIDANKLATLMSTIYYSEKPTIAIIQGPAFGGALGLIACCHIAIASTSATFCFSEVKLGLIPAVISPYIINAIGQRHARAYFLTGARFDAHCAQRIGLCHEIAEPHSLEEHSKQFIKKLLQNAPQALIEVNMLINNLHVFPITPDINHLTAKKIAEIRASQEGQEGLSAFLEKRKPNWIKTS